MLQKNTIKRMKERERLKRTQSFIEFYRIGRNRAFHTQDEKQVLTSINSETAG